MKTYMLLIHGNVEDEAKWADTTPAEMQAALAKYMAYSERLKSEGRLKGGDGLNPGGKILVNGADGVVITDGPFAEAKEIVGGYYCYTAADMDEAVAIAQDCPALAFGSRLEVRQIMDY